MIILIYNHGSGGWNCGLEFSWAALKTEKEVISHVYQEQQSTVELFSAEMTQAWQRTALSHQYKPRGTVFSSVPTVHTSFRDRNIDDS